MKKKKYRLQKDLTLLTFSFFILVFVWVSFTIYHSHATSTITDTQQIQIKPIFGKFDTATIDKLKKRTVVRPDFASPLGTESSRTTEFTPVSSEPIVEPTAEPTLQPTTEPAIPLTPAATDTETLQLTPEVTP